jgi:hypothetical protein
VYYKAGYDYYDSTCSSDATSYVPSKLQTCAATSCGSSYYVTTTCTSSTPAPVPTLAPITMPPSQASPIAASGYMYQLDYNSGCSTLYGGTLTKLNTCIPYTTAQPESSSNVVDAIGTGYVYQIVTVKCDPDCSTPTTLYYLTVYYSDSACTKAIPNPEFGSLGKYTYSSKVTSNYQCPGGSYKIGTGTLAALSSVYPASTSLTK